MCVAIYVWSLTFLLQLMYIAYSNLLSVQNIFKIYASEISFWPSHHVEHNGTIGIQNETSMNEIKYVLESFLY